HDRVAALLEVDKVVLPPDVGRPARRHGVRVTTQPTYYLAGGRPPTVRAYHRPTQALLDAPFRIAQQLEHMHVMLDSFRRRTRHDMLPRTRRRSEPYGVRVAVVETGRMPRQPW